MDEPWAPGAGADRPDRRPPPVRSHLYHSLYVLRTGKSQRQEGDEWVQGLEGVGRGDDLLIEFFRGTG